MSGRVYAVCAPALMYRWREEKLLNLELILADGKAAPDAREKIFSAVYIFPSISRFLFRSFYAGLRSFPALGILNFSQIFLHLGT